LFARAINVADRGDVNFACHLINDDFNVIMRIIARQKSARVALRSDEPSTAARPMKTRRNMENAARPIDAISIYYLGLVIRINCSAVLI